MPIWCVPMYAITCATFRPKYFFNIKLNIYIVRILSWMLYAYKVFPPLNILYNENIINTEKESWTTFPQQNHINMW